MSNLKKSIESSIKNLLEQEIKLEQKHDASGKITSSTLKVGELAVSKGSKLYWATIGDKRISTEKGEAEALWAVVYKKWKETNKTRLSVATSKALNEDKQTNLIAELQKLDCKGK